MLEQIVRVDVRVSWCGYSTLDVEVLERREMLE